MYIMATYLILPPSIVPCTHNVPARQIFFLSQGKAQLLLATGLSVSLSLNLHVQRMLLFHMAASFYHLDLS